MIECFRKRLKAIYPAPVLVNPKARGPPSGQPSPIKKRTRVDDVASGRQRQSSEFQQAHLLGPSTGIFAETSDHLLEQWSKELLSDEFEDVQDVPKETYPESLSVG